MVYLCSLTGHHFKALISFQYVSATSIRSCILVLYRFSVDCRLLESCCRFILDRTSRVSLLPHVCVRMK